MHLHGWIDVGAHVCMWCGGVIVGLCADVICGACVGDGREERGRYWVGTCTIYIPLALILILGGPCCHSKVSTSF